LRSQLEFGATVRLSNQFSLTKKNLKLIKLHFKVKNHIFQIKTNKIYNFFFLIKKIKDLVKVKIKANIKL
jgi:hypothetical protein